MEKNAADIIRKGKNVYYFNYTFDVQNQTNNTNGFTISFPNPTMNIKANNAFICIEKLAYLNYAVAMGDDIPVVGVQTSIPSSQCYDMAQNPQQAVSKGFFQIICWDRFFLDDLTKNDRNAYIYKNNNVDETKVFCANPMGNSFNLSSLNLTQQANE